MSWSRRLQQMVLAGGMLSAGCGGNGARSRAVTFDAGVSEKDDPDPQGTVPTFVNPPGPPCGNLVSDPCAVERVCGGGSAILLAVCDERDSCRDAGATWVYAPEAGVFSIAGTCQVDGGDDSSDADGGTD